MGKKRIIKKFEQLSPEMITQFNQKFPDGFEDSLITFANPKGEIELAVPFETEDTYYLIKMPKNSRASDDDDDNDNSYDGFDNFENLEIADDVADDDDDD